MIGQRLGYRDFRIWLRDEKKEIFFSLTNGISRKRLTSSYSNFAELRLFERPVGLSFGHASIPAHLLAILPLFSLYTGEKFFSDICFYEDSFHNFKNKNIIQWQTSPSEKFNIHLKSEKKIVSLL